jgi:hypothetical protein
MENRASKNRPQRIAFVLTPALLDRLVVVLSEASEDLEFTVKFVDGTTVEYDGVQKITQLPNSNHRSIVSLIAGTAGDARTSVNVVLKAKAEGDEPSVEYTVGGTQRNVVYLSDQLDDWVAGIRQWYSFGFSPGAGIVLFFVAMFLPPEVWKYTAHFFFSQSLLQNKSYSWIEGLSMVLMWVAEYFVFQLFPRGTFAIGRGATRYQFLNSLRWGVLVAVVVSFISSVVANLVTRH